MDQRHECETADVHFTIMIAILQYNNKTKNNANDKDNKLKSKITANNSNDYDNNNNYTSNNYDNQSNHISRRSSTCDGGGSGGSDD